MSAKNTWGPSIHTDYSGRSVLMRFPYGSEQVASSLT